MSAATITERDAVLRARAAYVEGYGDGWSACDPLDVPTVRKSAAERYPLPKVTRARVLADEAGVEFRFCGGIFEGRGAYVGPQWKAYREWGVTAERVRIWADLLANPFEEVDDDGGAD